MKLLRAVLDPDYWTGDVRESVWSIQLLVDAVEDVVPCSLLPSLLPSLRGFNFNNGVGTKNSEFAKAASNWLKKVKR